MEVDYGYGRSASLHKRVIGRETRSHSNKTALGKLTREHLAGSIVTLQLERQTA